MDMFCTYVNELQINFEIEMNECPTIKSTLVNYMSDKERILYYIKGVSDMTSVPPFFGFVVLTDYHLIFHGSALVTRTTSIDLTEVNISIVRTKIGGFFQRDTALKINDTWVWNIANINCKRRDELFWNIQTMLNAHELSSMVNEENNELKNKIKRKIIREASDDILRQNALKSMVMSEESDAIPYLLYANINQKMEYISEIRNAFKIIEKEHSSANVLSSLWMTFTDHQLNESKEHNLDPIQELHNIEYEIIGEEIEYRGQERIYEEFDVKEFYKWIKILRIEFEPLIIGIRFYKSIVQWKNPGLTLVIVILLIFISYMDWIYLIPGTVLICNALLMIAFKCDQPSMVSVIDRALTYAGYNINDDEEREDIEQYLERKFGEQKKEERFQIIKKIKIMRRKLAGAKFSLGIHQKKLKRLGILLGKCRALYLWNIRNIDQSQLVCVLSFMIGILLCFISMRAIFVIIVCGVFFKYSPFRNSKRRKYRMVDHDGPIDHFFNSVEPDLPEVDDDDDSSDCEDNVSEEEVCDQKNNGECLSSNSPNDIQGDDVNVRRIAKLRLRKNKRKSG